MLKAIGDIFCIWAFSRNHLLTTRKVIGFVNHPSVRPVVLLELTILWEDKIEDACGQRRTKCVDLVGKPRMISAMCAHQTTHTKSQWKRIPVNQEGQTLWATH